MIRFIVSVWGLAGAWAWVLLINHRRPVTVIGSVVLAVATLLVFVHMARRSERLRGEHEYVNARLEYHSGFSRGRWKRATPASGDDGGSEFTLGSGW